MTGVVAGMLGRSDRAVGRQSGTRGNVRRPIQSIVCACVMLLTWHIVAERINGLSWSFRCEPYHKGFALVSLSYQYTPSVGKLAANSVQENTANGLKLYTVSIFDFSPFLRVTFKQPKVDITDFSYLKRFDALKIDDISS